MHELYCLLILIYSRFSVSPTDYEPLSTILKFDACETQSCVNITIHEDMVLEENELFGITLERTDDLDERIVLNPVKGQIDIENTDSMFGIIKNVCFEFMCFNQELLWVLRKQCTVCLKLRLK